MGICTFEWHPYRLHIIATYSSQRRVVPRLPSFSFWTLHRQKTKYESTSYNNMASSSATSSDKSDKKKMDRDGYLSQLVVRYNYCVMRHPILTKSVTSAVTAGLGNIVSQKIVKRGKGELVDYRPVAAFSTFGFCVTGPLIHYFYEALDKIIPRQVSYSKAKRLLVDRGLFSPLFLLLFFYVVAILEGKSHKEAIVKIRQMYWTALKMSWRVWIVFQYVNLNYIPRQYRVLCGNLMSFLWSVYLASKRS